MFKRDTYLQTLACDIGKKLGCGAYLEKLTRTKIGKFKLTDAIGLDKINLKEPKTHLAENRELFK